MTFSPLAWLKLQLFLHAGDTEVSGFGLSSEDDFLYVQDFITVEQVTSSVTVEFTDAAVADYYDRCVDSGIQPARFARIWIHTHPGSSPDPSSVDEETFDRVFGACDWSLMFIIGRTGRTYARLAFNTGPGGSIQVPVQVDWAAWPGVLQKEQDSLAELFEQWMHEFTQNIHPHQPPKVTCSDSLRPSGIDLDYGWSEFSEILDDDRLDLVERMDMLDQYDLVEVRHG